MTDCPRYTIAYDSAFDRILKKLKRRDPALLTALDLGIEKILKEPMLGKPLKNVLRNSRRLHIEGSFVLLYEIYECQVRLLDFDHHDRIYRKYS
ncbi:MAG: type II toxin-antitoxin system RelE/ParE family toxin [bacterium]|nr:type II toxin-antitoxin system RelE/ParE family toxin [bacterium]